MNTVLSRDTTTIAFDRSGQGPALILVTGAFSTRADAAPLVAHLAPHFSVFAYDRRGRGDSGDTAPYAVEREVEDLEAVIAEAGGSAFVYGHSSGAVLSLEAARKLSSAITKLAVYEPPLIVDASRPSVPPDYLAHLTELIASGRRGDAVEYSQIRGIGIPAEAVAQMRNDPIWQELEALAHTMVYDSTIAVDTLQGTPLALAKWASVAMPTLVMDGGDSPPWIHTWGASAGGDLAQRAASPLSGAGSRRRRGRPHARIGGVLQRLRSCFKGWFGGTSSLQRKKFLGLSCGKAAAETQGRIREGHLPLTLALLKQSLRDDRR